MNSKIPSEKFNKYDHLFNSMNQGVVYQNSDGYISDANPAAQRLLGLSLDQLQGRLSIDSRWKSIKLDGSDFPGEEHPAMVALKTGKTVLNQVMGIYHPLKDDHVWILVSAEPVFDENSGNPTEVYTTFTDITDRVIAEKRLEHQSKLQTILTDISGSFINLSSIHTDEVINSSLKSLGEYLGCDRSYIFDYEHEKKNIRNTYEWCKKGIEPQIEHLQETPFSMVPEWIDAHFNGKSMNIPDVSELDKEDTIRQILEPQEIKSLITVPITDNNKCIGFVGVDSVANHKNYGDIDEKILRIYAQLLVNLYKKIDAQKEIEEKQSFLDGIFQASNSLIAIKSYEGKYLFVNKQWEELSGFKSEETIGRTDFELFPSTIASQYAKNDQRVLEEDIIIETEEVLPNEKNGQLRYLLSNKFPIKINKQETKGLCFIAFEITDRKKLESELLETNEILQNLVNSQTNYVLRVNMKGYLTYANPKYIQDFGWLHESGQVIGSNALTSIKDYHHQLTRETVETCVKRPGTIIKVELDKPHKNGTVLTTFWEFVCLTDKNGNPTEVQALGFDITNEKIVSKKLKQSENKYKTLFHDSPEGYLILEDKVFIECNNAAVNIIGYESKEKLIGKTPIDISPAIQHNGKKSVELASNLIERAYQDGYVNFEWVIKRDNNSTVLVNVTLSKIIYNNREVLFVTWHDITKERANEEKANLLTEVVEQSPMYVVITDPNGVIEYVNSSLGDKVGYDKDYLIGEKTSLWSSGFHKEEFYENLWNTILSGEKWTGEFYNKTKDGNHFWENAVISPIKDKNGNIKHLVAVKEDITVKKKMEDERIAHKEAEASNTAKSKFLSRMSHEIRTPLNAIMSYSYILQQNTSFDKKQHKQLKSINRNGNHLLQLIEDILDYSKIELGKIDIQKQVFSPKEIIVDMKYMFLQQTNDKGVAFSYNTTNLPEFISADEGKIRQILVNIIGNSVKFTDQGEVAIDLEFITNRDQLDGNLKITITDTGPGMTEYEVKNIFNEFEQFQLGKDKGGTGLGMAISQKLVRALNGKIVIKSEVDKGTQVTITIPVDVANKEHDNTKINNNETTVYKKANEKNNNNLIKILIVDDNVDNRETLLDLLEPHQFELHTAINGQEGFEKAEEIVPHIILMDIRMPILDGYKSSIKIKTELSDKKIKIIAVTASEFERDEEKLSYYGIDDYMRKPFQPEKLFEKIYYWVSELSLNK